MFHDNIYRNDYNCCQDTGNAVSDGHSINILIISERMGSFPASFFELSGEVSERISGKILYAGLKCPTAVFHSVLTVIKQCY